VTFHQANLESTRLFEQVKVERDAARDELRHASNQLVNMSEEIRDFASSMFERMSTLASRDYGFRDRPQTILYLDNDPGETKNEGVVGIQQQTTIVHRNDPEDGPVTTVIEGETKSIYCPSASAAGRQDRCGLFAAPQRCKVTGLGNIVCSMTDALPKDASDDRSR
jgi:hypothetical protein